MIFKFGELYCGPGGLSLGAGLAKIETEDGEVFEIEHAWANDYDQDTCDTYNANIGENLAICGDVRKLDIASLDKISSFAFGFPCNDFSIVGEQNGMDGVFGPLYTYGIKTLDAHNPAWFIAENVGGITSANEGAAFKKILKAMTKAGDHGYNIVPHLYKFEEYSVPQKRHRVVIVGIRKDLDVVFRVPAPTTPTPTTQISAKTAIESPPILDDVKNNELTKQNARVVERLSHLGEGENAWKEDLPEHLKLNVKGAKLSQIYKRLVANAPAYTVTGSGGGGTHVYHWKEPRALTNRERARLQTFPDWFEFKGSKESVRKQIGMAVPTVAAKQIVEAVLKTFAGLDYDSIPANIKSSGEIIRAAKRDKMADIEGGFVKERASIYEQVVEIPYKGGWRELNAISGYASPAFIDFLLKRHPDIKINLIVGMVSKDGILESFHERMKILANSGHFNCYYYNGKSACHAKNFAWFNNEKSGPTFVGSANLSNQGFLRDWEADGVKQDGHIESISEGKFEDVLDLYQELFKESVNCLDASVPAEFKLYKTEVSGDKKSRKTGGVVAKGLDSVMLPLFSLRTKDIHKKAGLNWGQRPGREPNQAYIPIPREVHDKNPGFFPSRKHHFIIDTDDGKQFTGVVAQENSKALESTENNSLFGKYFRDRLGMSHGDFVTMDHLLKYGRTDVTIYKIDDDHFYLNFSV